MPALTRRRSSDHREQCWHIYYGDVHVGTITERVGNPHDTDQWEWSCLICPAPDHSIGEIEIKRQRIICIADAFFITILYCWPSWREELRCAVKQL